MSDLLPTLLELYFCNVSWHRGASFKRGAMDISQGVGTGKEKGIYI